MAEVNVGSKNTMLTIGIVAAVFTIVLFLLIILNKYSFTNMDNKNIDTPIGVDEGPIESNYTATIKTNMGEIVLALYDTKAPNTVNNFMDLSNKGFYNGLIFHRVIPDL